MLQYTGTLPYSPQYYGLDQFQIDSLKSIALFSEQFLRFIPRNIKNYPSHGVDHSISIINFINDFIENWGILLKKEEIYLLYASAWLHDIGCIRDRETHNLESVNILLEDEGICTSINNVDKEALANLKWIINSHSSKFKIEDVPEKRKNVRLRLISAIFRLMDACEISYIKCPKSVFKEIERTLVDDDGNPDQDALAYWNAHMSIKSILIKKPNIEILSSNRTKSKIIIIHLEKEIGYIRETFGKNKICVPSIKLI